MNQSEFEANTCNRHQAREKACERGTIGFGLVSHWLKKWRELLANHRAQGSKTKAITKLLSTLNRKPLYYITKPRPYTCLRIS